MTASPVIKAVTNFKQVRDLIFPMVRTSSEVCACTDNLEPNPGSKLQNYHIELKEGIQNKQNYIEGMYRIIKSDSLL